ncbi:hypothetical protein HYQ44_020193 [Verticillium longisporum]|nr:hypothetical protein HYQ44_020193 [Verticillium longisporum]
MNVAHAGDQRNVPESEQEQPERFHEGKEHAHNQLDSKDERTIANKLAAEEQKDGDDDSEETRLHKIDPTLPILFVINSPEVYKSPNSNTYILMPKHPASTCISDGVDAIRAIIKLVPSDVKLVVVGSSSGGVLATSVQQLKDKKSKSSSGTCGARPEAQQSLAVTARHDAAIAIVKSAPESVQAEAAQDAVGTSSSTDEDPAIGHHCAHVSGPAQVHALHRPRRARIDA